MQIEFETFVGENKEKLRRANTELQILHEEHQKTHSRVMAFEVLGQTIKNDVYESNGHIEEIKMDTVNEIAQVRKLVSE